MPSDGSYNIPTGVIYGFPCTTENGDYKIVQGLEHNDFARSKIDATVSELRDERKTVEDLLKS